MSPCAVLVVPSHGRIDAGMSQQVTCYFTPDHASERYRTTVNVAGEDMTCKGGMGWAC